VVICLQPHRVKRPSICVRAQHKRLPICALINPAFQPLIDSAEAAIAGVLDRRLFTLIGKENHQFRVQLANPTQLKRYLHSGLRPPRFPAGGRKRLLDVWRSKPEGAIIEITEFLTVFGMQARHGGSGK
jgi:hypothetical protein